MLPFASLDCTGSTTSNPLFKQSVAHLSLEESSSLWHPLAFRTYSKQGQTSLIIPVGAVSSTNQPRPSIPSTIISPITPNLYPSTSSWPTPNNSWLNSSILVKSSSLSFRAGCRRFVISPMMSLTSWERKLSLRNTFETSWTALRRNQRRAVWPSMRTGQSYWGTGLWALTGRKLNDQIALSSIPLEI